MRGHDLVRVRHMVEAAETALQFMSGRTRTDLDRDRLLLFAVVRAVEIVGEAAARITDPTRAENPSVPWTAIAGMRNRLIHGYFDIDTEILWRTATVEIPELLPKLRSLIEVIP